MIEASGRDSRYIYRMKFLDNGKVVVKVINAMNCDDNYSISYDTHEEGLRQLKYANTFFSYEKNIKEAENNLKNLQSVI